MRLLDTNIVIYHLGGRLAHPLSEGEYAVSVITELELLSYSDFSDAEEQATLEFLRRVRIIGLSQETKRKTVEIRRGTHMKLPDAIIAATALALDLELITNDPMFKQVKEISCTSLPLVDLKE